MADAGDHEHLSDLERRRIEAQRPVLEAGGGEAEGFELAEEELIEHASHGDQQSAHAILHHQGAAEEESANHDYGEPDLERKPD